MTLTLNIQDLKGLIRDWTEKLLDLLTYFNFWIDFPNILFKLIKSILLIIDKWKYSQPYIIIIEEVTYTLMKLLVFWTINFPLYNLDKNDACGI